MQQRVQWTREKLKNKPYTRYDALRCATLSIGCVVASVSAMGCLALIVAGGHSHHAPLPDLPPCGACDTSNAELDWFEEKNAELYDIVYDDTNADDDVLVNLYNTPKPAEMVRNDEIPLAIAVRSQSM